LAFAPDGRRLGRGKGFYDRWLAAHPHVPRVAITSERHLWSHVPTDPWDMRVDVVVTESRVHRVVRG
jgi:5-formyltetrahydrofolate cyclo-ligase